jgi:cytochrome P450
MTSQVGSTDLTDLSLFADGPPFEVFRTLRECAPVHWNASAAGPGFWSLTRYADIEAASRDWRSFSSERRGVTIEEGSVFPAEMQQFTFVMMDPPRHVKHRSIVHQVFTPRVIREHEPRMRAVIAGLLDDFVAHGGGDFVEDVAVDFPLVVIAEILGVPAADRRRLFGWTNMFADTSITPEQGQQLMLEMGMYVMGLVAERREHPTDDLLSALIHAEVDGERLTDVEVIAHFGQLMAAGNETTRNALSGGLLALLQRPEQLELLRAEPELVPDTVEEVLRWTSPVLYQARTATRDLEISGVPIKEDDLVVLWFAAGNRDPSVFGDPEVFDVRRGAGERQMAFGGFGRHFCLGSQLARAELRIAFEEVLRRVPDARQAGPVVRETSNVFNWIRHLPLSL